MGVRRGTTNGNVRGSAADRLRRRQWLVETYRANVDVGSITTRMGRVVFTETTLSLGYPACRCYRCGTLLTVETVTVDRIIPGCKGGTYRRSNIRPACQPCNSVQGGGLRS